MNRQELEKHIIDLHKKSNYLLRFMNIEKLYHESFSAIECILSCVEVYCISLTMTFDGFLAV